MAERFRGAGGYTDGPLRALPGPGISWTITTGADTWGLWTVLIADTGPEDAYLLAATVENPGPAVAGVHLRVTAGEYGAPEPLAAWRVGRLGAGASIHLPAGVPIRVRAHSRLAFAAAAASAVTLSVGVSYVLLGVAG